MNSSSSSSSKNIIIINSSSSSGSSSSSRRSSSSSISQSINVLFYVCSHQGDIRQKTKQNKTRNKKQQQNQHSPIHLLRTNITKVIILCLQGYELSILQ